MENYQITRDQIRKLTDPQVREWFPEAFKNELEVGKWYKHEDSGCLAFVEKVTKKDFIGYGFGSSQNWLNSSENWTLGFLGWEEATEEEVFEALKNEAVKRGFVEGVIFIEPENTFNFSDQKRTAKGIIRPYQKNMMCFSGTNSLIYKNGKWATIIETITRQEAEKLLNKKIID